MGKRKRLTALLCAVVMALTLLPVQAWATGEGEAAFSFASVALELDDSAAALYDDAGAEAEFVPETDPYFDHVTVTRYGRTKLAQEQNSKALLDVYDALVICAVVTNLPQDYVVLENGVDKDTFVLAAQAFRADYPELFWAVPASMYLPDDPDHYIAVSLQRWSDFAPDENGSDAYLTNKKREFLANVESLLDGLPAGSDYDKELYLHDRLIERTEYDSDYEEQQSAFSVVMEGRGVCAGYAFAFQYLLMRAGIESYYVVGQSYGENHAWNLVKVDGQWYYVDPTWDDPRLLLDEETGETGQSPYSPHYAYFNITTAMLQEDHTIAGAPDNVPLPDCTATDAFYHRVNDSIVSANDTDLSARVAYLLRRDNGVARVYTEDDDSSAIKNWFLTDETVRKLTEELNATYVYSLEALPVGRETVLLFNGEFDKYIVGELNGRGKIDIQDVQVLYAYLTTGSTAESPLTWADFQIAADMNGDGAIDVYDLQALYEIVCGIG